MPAPNDPDEVNRESELAQAVWKQIRMLLEKQQDRLQEEIRSYPPPIPACDEQFNCLLEERARVSRELVRMNEAAKAPDSLGACGAFIDELAASLNLLSDEAAEELRSCLREGGPPAPLEPKPRGHRTV